MARSKVVYEPDFRGLGELARSPDMQRMCASAANRGKTYAGQIAPRGETGEYARSFRVESSPRGEGRWADRAEARLVNDSDHAAAVEWRNRGGMRILGKAVDVIEKAGP